MNLPDLDISLLEQLPPWYRSVLDYQEICQSEQEQLDALALAINEVGDNFFFQTMDEAAVQMWESVFNIVPDPVSESLDFRRTRVLNRVSTRPPFSLGFLYQKLDELIGPGAWAITVDYANYTLYIESSATDQQYAQEVAITVGRIKPAHIVYINIPRVDSGLALSEAVSKANIQWNYRLGAWKLGMNPFQTIYSEEVVKMADTPSIQTKLLNDTAAFIGTDVAKARINGSVIISGITKTVSGDTLTVTYPVSPTAAATVTLAELLDSSNNVLTSAIVYAPTGADGIQMKHIISVEEGN